MFIETNKIIDSHCHPQFPQYDNDRKEIIKRALDAGVQMICVGTDLEMSKKAIELAQKHEGPTSPKLRRASIWATVGLHPNEKQIYDLGFKIYEYEKLLNDPKVVAVGEIGLDYYRTPELEKQKTQRDVFQQFLELTSRISKPLIIHCRNAHQDLIPILKSYIVNLKSKTEISGVIHSFTGNLQEAREYIELGFYLGFNGIVTFARQYDEVVKYAPLDKILLETDAPYLTPEPYRGQRNEPLYVIEVSKKIAELKNISVEEAAEQTTKNTQNLFNLK